MAGSAEGSSPFLHLFPEGVSFAGYLLDGEAELGEETVFVCCFVLLLLEGVLLGEGGWVGGWIGWVGGWGGWVEKNVPSLKGGLGAGHSPFARPVYGVGGWLGGWV